MHVVDGGGPGDARISAPPVRSLRERIEQALADAGTPLTRRALRRACRMRASTLGHVLGRLIADGRVARSPDGYALLRP